MQEFAISAQWNGVPIDHNPVKVRLIRHSNYLGIEVEAPFFDDPKPDGLVGKSFPCLWDYEG